MLKCSSESCKKVTHSRSHGRSRENIDEWWVLALALDWLSSRVNNVKGGRRNTSTRTVEPGAPAGG